MPLRKPTKKLFVMSYVIKVKANLLMEGIKYEDFENKGFVRANTATESRNFMKNGWPTDFWQD